MTATTRRVYFTRKGAPAACDFAQRTPFTVVRSAVFKLVMNVFVWNSRTKCEAFNIPNKRALSFYPVLVTVSLLTYTGKAYKLISTSGNSISGCIRVGLSKTHNLQKHKFRGPLQHIAQDQISHCYHGPTTWNNDVRPIYKHCKIPNQIE